MKYCIDHVEVVADEIVERMTKRELEQYVYDDLVALMGENKELFENNVESLGINDCTCDACKE